MGEQPFGAHCKIKAIRKGGFNCYTRWWAAAAAEEEKTEFDVVLKDAGAEKIKVIKVVREVVSGLGLKEAKDIVESAPKTIKEAVSKEEAEKIAEQFKAVGATVEIK